MGDGHNRQSWSDYIRRLKERPGWSVARLARETGFSTSTFWDWMKPESRKAVTIPRIVAVARAVGDNPVDAFKAAAGLTTTEPEDAEIAVVLNAVDVSDEQREQIINDIMARRERDRSARMEDTIQMITLAGGKVA